MRRVHVVSYSASEGILGEVFTNEGTGTLIVADINALPAHEQHSGPAAPPRAKGTAHDTPVGQGSAAGCARTGLYGWG